MPAHLLFPVVRSEERPKPIPPNPQLQPEAIWPYTELRPIRSYFLPALRFGRLHGVYQVGLLSELTVGEKGVLVALDLPENVQNHLMHMGFVPGAEVTALRRAPAGDPTLYGIDGLEIALRHETASAIQIRPIEIRSAAAQAAAIQPNAVRSVEAQPAKIRSSDVTAQPGHESLAAPKRSLAVAPKLAEAAR